MLSLIKLSGNKHQENEKSNRKMALKIVLLCRNYNYKIRRLDSASQGVKGIIQIRPANNKALQPLLYTKII
jgi:hypothetical protein